MNKGHKATNDRYRAGWDRVFGKKEVKEMGCGRKGKGKGRK